MEGKTVWYCKLVKWGYYSLGAVPIRVVGICAKVFGLYRCIVYGVA